MIAHSQLNTNDLGITLCAFACLYVVQRWLRRFSWRRLIASGLLLGMAMATKATGLLLAPIVGALFGWGYVQSRRKTRAGRWLVYLLIVLGVSLLTLWGVYGFEWRARPGLPGPLPLASHISMLNVLANDRYPMAFALGLRQPGGWWWYFMLVFALKTPLPLSVALLAALLTGARPLRHWIWRQFPLWIFPLFYIAVAIWSRLNVGYRHLLPVFPFIYLAIGRLGPWLLQMRPSRRQRIIQWGAAALGVWYITGTIQVYPFDVAYFNELIGGPRQGYRYLVDSNVDWGHAFKALAAYMKTAGIEQIKLSHYSWVDPAAYGIRYSPLPPAPGAGTTIPHPYNPEPGFYAISASPLQGLLLQDPDLYEWFRQREPIAQPGYGLLVYQVPPARPLKWIAQCAIPVAPLTPPLIRAGLGQDDLRQIQFDCTQSWIYPEGGASRGQYGFFRKTWLEQNRFLDNHLAPARLSYQQVHTGYAPPFVLFEWSDNSRRPLSFPQDPVRAAPSNWPLSRVEAEGVQLTPPIRLDGPLTFLGHRVSSNRALELWTTWQVEGTPSRPLSIMAHLIRADNTPVAVGDGLGVQIDQWQAGDVIIQRHHLLLPADAPPGVYWLQSGVYWLDTLERWPIGQEGKQIGDRLVLTTIKK